MAILFGWLFENAVLFPFAGGDRGLNVELDPCLSNPCLNRGECIQLRFGRYKCECTGTNFFGDKCQKGKQTRLEILSRPKAPQRLKKNTLSS